MQTDVALIGFGEAGSTFAQAANWAERACAYDIRSSRGAVMASLGVREASSASAALVGAPVVLSLVTADQAQAAAEDYAGFLQLGAIWCDMNSVAPATKRAAARAVIAAGGRYVDVAIMAPVGPLALNIPLLISGADADEAAAALTAAGFGNIDIAGDEIGRASAIKLIRSVMVKGIEALTDEMMAAAQAAGVTSEVLASLDASEKPQAWSARAAYNLDRMAVHGLRRAAEMEQAALTLAGLGIQPVMTTATVQRQRDAGERQSRSTAA